MKFKQILLKARKEVFSNYEGAKNISLIGEGSDFRELREYVYGDDVRHINWKASSKSVDKTYVNVFDVSKSVEVEIIYLLSGGLYFGSHRLKSEVVLEVGAYLSYSAFAQDFRLKEVIFTDKVEQKSEVIKDMKQIDEFLSSVKEFKLLNSKVSYAKLSEYINMSSGKKMFILIGDFFSDEFKLPPIKSKHEVLAIIVRDRLEEELSNIGDIALVDPSSADYYGGGVSKGTIEKYNAYMASNSAKLKAELNRSGVRFQKIFGDDDVFKSLVRFFV